VSEIDLGPVTVSLVSMPSGAGKNPAPAQTPVAEVHTNPHDAALRGLPMPAALPDGVEFLDATLFRSPIAMAIWTYADVARGRSITIARTPIASLKTSPGGKPTAYVAGQSMTQISLGNAAAASVALSADRVSPAAQESLVWLKDGAVIQLIGRGLVQGELERVANSL
jgi:hypothetical protein